MILSANTLLAGLFIAVGLFIGGYFLGKADQRTDDEAAKVKPLVAAIAKHDIAAAAGQTVERATVARVTQTEATFKGILLGVKNNAQTHPVVDCSLDADGLRLWRAANANADLESAGSGYGGLPTAGSAVLGQDAGLAGRPRGDGAVLSPVPGASPGAGRLDQGD